MKRSGALTILFVAIVVLLPRASCGGAPLLGRPAVLNRKTDNSTIYDARYYYQDGSVWDHTGNPVKLIENFGTGDYTYALRYDAVARQIEETRTNPGQTQDYSGHYTYDQVGNRLSRLSDATTPNVTTNWTYDDNDKLTSASEGSKTASFYYDEPHPTGPLGGNITKITGNLYGVWTLAYDDENQLTSVTYPGGVNPPDQFWYNAFGQRFRAKLGASLPNYRYLYAGDRLMEELDDNGGVLGRYTAADDSFYSPWLHMQRNDGNSRFPLYNMTGTARRLVDATGTVTEVYSYDTFGKGGLVSGSAANPFRYGGAWGYMTDPSALLQLGYRNYWPEIGRFLQQDPIREGVNWYAYVGNDPSVLIDPEGLAYMIWDQTHSTLALYHGDNSLWGVWSGVSGLPGKYAGITPGTYRVDPKKISDIRSPNAPLRSKVYRSLPWVAPSWGPARVTLEPTPDTAKRIQGRGNQHPGGKPGGFFLHGGTHPGTSGCIRLPTPDIDLLLGILNNIGTPVALHAR